MRRLLATLAAAAFVTAASFTFISHVSAQAPGGGPPPGGGPGQGRPMGGPTPEQIQRFNYFNSQAVQDSIAADRDSTVNVEMQRIAGKENAPAESVFKNIKIMKKTPAAQLLRIMNLGYSRSLGVGCNFCHVSGHWADEDKDNKQIARDMIVMTAAINDTLLPRVSNPDHDRRFMNCYGCHHGHTNPNFDPSRFTRPQAPGAPAGNH